MNPIPILNVTRTRSTKQSLIHGSAVLVAILDTSVLIDSPSIQKIEDAKFDQD
jgi:hypothetical protein